MCVQVQEFWNGIPEIPIYERGRTSRYTAQEVVSILGTKHNETPKCAVHPMKVRWNLAFVIDLKKYKHWEDVKSDMNGVYNGVLRCGVWTVEIDIANEEEVNVQIVAKKAMPLTSDKQFHLVLHSKKNKAGPSLARSIFLLKDKSGSIVKNTCIVQYHILDGSETAEFTVHAHGNATSGFSKAFFPSKKSTLEAIRKDIQEKTSGTSVYSSLIRNAGGADGARSASDLPRSRHQIYNLKSRLTVGNADCE